MKKKVITFVVLLFAVSVCAVIAHEVGRQIQQTKDNVQTSTDAEIDYSMYYTYAEVENIVSYLSDTTSESEALSRLIDPLKKSQPIDVRFMKDIAKTIQVKDMVYVDVLQGKKDSDYVTKEEFEEIYENIVASATVKGLLRQDLLVLKLQDDDKTSFYDGHEMYHAEFTLKDSYEGSIIDVYMKNGRIFKVNGLGDSKITLPNVWVETVQNHACTFLYEDLEETCVVRDDAQIEDAQPEVATSLDAQEKTAADYETAGYVADLVFDYAGICEVKKSTDILRGKVISVGDTDLQMENIGGLTLAEDFKIYNVYENVSTEESLSLLLGYSYVDMYMKNGKISVAVINQELKSENIRVILNNDDYSSYEMERVELTGTSSFTVTYPDETTKQFSEGEIVTFIPSDYAPEDIITVTPDTHSGRMKVLSVTREAGNPEYDGTIELDIFDAYIYVINEVSLERYLANVVANAMPSDYPIAAQQAMAICARGTAYAKLKDESYAEYHAHLDDSSLCQVYNNVSETEMSIRAVKDTYGLVPTYRGTLIVPMTFNTSFGMTCTNAEIWGGDSYSYLESNVENIDKTRLDLSKEDDFEDFMKDASQYDIIDKDSGYYRWSISFTKEEMTQAVESTLEERKSLMADSIQIENEDGGFTSGEIPDIGTVESIEVAERTQSGVVAKLIIRGSLHTISVSGQSNVRAILTPVNQEIIKQDDSVITGWTSLPSPYYYVEKTDAGFVVHGGGFGHGAGMSIYGAGVLGRQGKSYKYILRHYFSYVDFASIYTMDDGEETADSE